jgi:sigma-B regulation protein RsbU (phosphoserine phosphatase)
VPRQRHRSGAVEVNGTGGTILGVYAKPAVARQDACLCPGDTLLLVTEARGPEGFYGEEKLDALLAGCTGRSACSISDLIIDEVLRFHVGTPRDDVAVLVLQAAVPAAVSERTPE